MDKLDVSIMRSLFSDVHRYPSRSEIRESMSSLARKINVSEPTLRSRVNGYEKSGFLKGWSVFVNPNLIGQHVGQVHLDVLPPSSKDDALKKIKLIDGVWLIAKYHGNTVAVGLFYDNEASLMKRVELMTRITNAEHVVHGQILFPPCDYRFTRNDMAIITSIQERPGLAYSSIAKEMHLSTRTVRRRLNRMLHERALFMAPKLDFREMTGAIGADVFVFYVNKEAARQTERRVLALVDKVLVASIPGGPEHLYASLVLENLEQAEEILNGVKRLEGVGEVYVDLIEEHLPQYQVFKEQIETLMSWQAHQRGVNILRSVAQIA